MRQNLILLQKLESFHQLFYESFHKLPKKERYALGLKIDGIIIDMLKSLYLREKISDLNKKEDILQEFDLNLAILKYFFRLLYSRKSITERKYHVFSEKLIEIGKILGGLLRKNAPQKEATKR